MTSFPLFKWLVRGLAAAFGLTLAWLATTAVRAQDAAPSGVLGKVPADAAAFVHVKAADVWKSEVASSFRDMISKAGPDAFKAFNSRFLPPPGNLDSLAAYLLPMSDEGPQAIGLIVSFSSTFDQTKVVKSLLPKGVAMNHFGQKYTLDQTAGLALKVIDNKTLLLASKNDMNRLVGHDAPANGPLTPLLVAASKAAIFAGADVASLPEEMRQQMPDALRAMDIAKTAVLSCDVGKDLAWKLSFKFADATAATAAEKSAKDGFKAMRDQIAETIKDSEKKLAMPEKNNGLVDMPNIVGGLMMLASARALDQYLAQPPLTVSGDELTMAGRLDPTHPQTVAMAGLMSMGVLKPTTERVQAATVAAKGQNNLKQLALAMHAYHSARGNFPSGLFNKDGKKALLSWRVAILPYLEQSDLYKQFKLEEPWDSDHNKKLIAKMPTVFADADAPPAKEPGQTHYQVFVGPGAGFQLAPRGTKIFDITDGTSATIMITTAADPVPWTKPVDLAYSPGKALPKVGFGGNKKINAVMFDGSVHSFPANISPAHLKALITIAGSELIGD